jgi:hypothetical protein
MRNQVEFQSTAFPASPGEDETVNPGVFGKRLAEFLAAELPKHGFVVASVAPEDWGWMVELDNAAFPLWIGCANQDGAADAFQCFIEPSKPFVRKWFSKIDTTERVNTLAAAMDAILRGSDTVTQIRWLDGDATAR